MTQRRIAGTIVFPPDTQVAKAARVRIELRDISLQDTDSILLASVELTRQAVGPGVELPFEMKGPEVDAARSLAVRVQVDRSASRGAQAPLLLTTATWPVPARGEVSQLRISLQQL
jgi:uncharacterized lipoprotein YbaY